MKHTVAAITLAGLLLSPLAMAKHLDVVASFSVLGDIVSNVGGDRVTVTDLVDPNGDPHAFEPTPQDSKTLANADVVFVNGLGLEGWIARLVSASGYHGPVVTASDGIKTLTMVEDGETETDPHAWNSAANGAIYAQNVIDALFKASPEDADYFRRQGQAYINQINALDVYAKKTFAAIAQDRRKVLTSHDAFGYFGQAYGVTFLSPVGYSTESEASSKKVAELIGQIKQENVKSYFIENQTDPRLVKQIAQASGAQPGGELYPEALSGNDGPASTYLAAFKHNVDTIAASMR